MTEEGKSMNNETSRKTPAGIMRHLHGPVRVLSRIALLAASFSIVACLMANVVLGLPGDDVIGKMLGLYAIMLVGLAIGLPVKTSQADLNLIN